MRNLRVRRKIDIFRRELDPFPIRRWHRFRDAFQRHHVFERKWVFAISSRIWRRRLSEDRAGKKQREKDKEFHGAASFYSVMSTEVETSLNISQTVRDFSTSLEMTRASDGRLCQ